MAYRSPVEEAPALLKRAILGTFDFRGRSTRTELFTFLFVSQFAGGMAALLIGGLLSDGDFGVELRIQRGVQLLFWLPFVALFARRLHDQNRTGWWTLLAVAVIPLSILSKGGNLHDLTPADFETQWWHSAVFFVAIIALWAISLWPPSEGANRFGPNPRLDPEPADQ